MARLMFILLFAMTAGATVFGVHMNNNKVTSHDFHTEFSHDYNEDWDMQTTPAIPEPSAALLFGLGALAIARRNR